MEKTFVETLDIRNVYQVRTSEWYIEIRFTIQNFEYTLAMKGIGGPYEIWGVYHEDKHVCPLCNLVAELPPNMGCRILREHQDDLFHRLIEHPSIRLEWLYIPYAVKA